MSTEEHIIFTDDLTFKYPEQSRLGLNNINIKMKKGEKLLLVGPNGAGKSTLLKILAGKKLISRGKLELFGINPFDLQNNYKINDKTIIYLGTEWANNEITKRDIKVDELISSIGGEYFTERRDKLIELLEINQNWSMNKCSDGERRRVQLCMGLLKPFDILLLDEVTIDLDVLVRQRLLGFLYDETINRGCCIIYATHIFDGLGVWADKVIHLRNGEIECCYKRENIIFDKELDDGIVVQDDAGDENKLRVGHVKSLNPIALEWLKIDRKLNY